MGIWCVFDRRLNFLYLIDAFKACRSALVKINNIPKRNQIPNHPLQIQYKSRKITRCNFPTHRHRNANRDNNYKTNADKIYPASVNVRKGYIVWKKSGSPDACSNNVPVPSGEPMTPAYPAYNGVMGLPQDSCFPSSCTLAGGRMGNGDWGGDTANSATVPDFEQYWSTNFGGTPRPRDSGGAFYSNTNLPTRYDIYRYEIANSLIATASAGVTISGTSYNERGTPACNPTNKTDNPDRRILYGAILNCRAAGLGSGASGGPYQSVAFGKFFITEPMGDPPDSTLWTELIDVVRPGEANSVARDLVQLYR